MDRSSNLSHLSHPIELILEENTNDQNDDNQISNQINKLRNLIFNDKDFGVFLYVFSQFKINFDIKKSMFEFSETFSTDKRLRDFLTILKSSNIIDSEGIKNSNHLITLINNSDYLQTLRYISKFQTFKKEKYSYYSLLPHFTHKNIIKNDRHFLLQSDFKNWIKVIHLLLQKDDAIIDFFQNLSELTTFTENCEMIKCANSISREQFDQYAKQAIEKMDQNHQEEILTLINNKTPLPDVPIKGGSLHNCTFIQRHLSYFIGFSVVFLTLFTLIILIFSGVL